MGDIQTTSSNKELFYIKKEFFSYVRSHKKLNDNEKFEIFKNAHRINILFMIMTAGSGHIGSSFSIIDFLIVYYNSNLKNNLIFSSKGHDSPAFYSIHLSLNNIPFRNIFKFRRLDGLPGHPDRELNIFPFNTGSLGMGISKAKGYSKIKKNIKIFVILGDGELQEGQIWESINTKINKKIKIIIDKNELQSDFKTKNTSDIGNIRKKLEAFGLKVKEINGHNYFEIDKALKNNDEYNCLILKTIKGYGVSRFHGNKKKYELKNYPFHSGAPNYETYLEAYNELIKKIYNNKNNDLNKFVSKFKNQNNSPKTIHQKSIIEDYSNFIKYIFKTNKNTICLDADLLIDHGLMEIKKRFPARLIECGIAEMDMVSQASGLSEAGKIPVCHSFSCFLSFRSLEQIYNNCSEKRKIIYTASLAGVIPSGPGHSHQAVKDFSNYATIPNLLVVEPLNEESFHLSYSYFIKNKELSLFFRLNPLPVAPIKPIKKTKIFDPWIIKSWNKKRAIAKKILVITYGLTLTQELKLAIDLKKGSANNYQLASLISLNRFNHKIFINMIKKSDKVYFFDNQIGGLTPFTLLVSELNSKFNFFFKYKNYSLAGFPKCGSNKEILDYYQLSCNHLVKKI